MKKLFICERPYPLYRTLLKSIVPDGEKADMIISNHVEGMDKLYEPLKSSGIFENVFYYDDRLYNEFASDRDAENFMLVNRWIKGYVVLFKKFLSYLKLQKHAKNIQLPDGLDFSRYDEIYVNDATSTLTFHLFSRKIPVIWVEHAIDAFRVKQVKKYNQVFYLLKVLDKLNICYALRGCSKYVSAVEVNDKSKLPQYLKGKKIREVSLKGLRLQLSPEQGEKIFRVFCQAFDIDVSQHKIIDILLTDPLYISGYTDNEKEQQMRFKQIIDKEMEGADLILIKPHPRDGTDYTNLVDNAIIIPPCVSAEIFALSNSLRFRKAVTINSSTLLSITNAQENIRLGLEYLERLKNAEVIANGKPMGF